MVTTFRTRLACIFAVLLVLTSWTIVATPDVAAADSAVSERPAALSPGALPAGATPLGLLDGAQEVQLNVVLPPSHPSQLQGLLQALDDPASPSYHQWLRPGQFAQEFGPTVSQQVAVRSWLANLGLSQISVSGFSIRVTAPAARFASALGTSFERYRTPSGHEGYRSEQVPLVPQSLAGGEISAILGLNTVTTFQSQLAPATRPLSLAQVVYRRTSMA